MSQSSMKDGAASQRAVELIREAMGESPLSLTDVAAKAGIPRPTLQNIVGGRANLYVEQLVRIASALDVDASAWVAVIEAERRADDDLATRRAAKKSATGDNVPYVRSKRTAASRRKRRVEDDPESST